ncbi:MAG: hypothetical protein ACFFED_07190 [Candidatus Thorarchaeota archaeon]
MKAFDLYEEYMQALAIPLITDAVDEINVNVIVLYRTSWIRIILVRSSSENSDRLEVELSLPSDFESSGKYIETAIAQIIDYLNYFLRLHRNGFQLDLIAQDFLWTATYEIRGEPSCDFFELLLPPHND